MSDTHPLTTNGTRPRRWDPVVKLTHWSIVIAIIVNAFIAEEGSTGHVWVGYALAAMLALRLLWGSSARAKPVSRRFRLVRDERYSISGT